jgi:hypothetical protein
MFSLLADVFAIVINGSNVARMKPHQRRNPDRRRTRIPLSLHPGYVA